jgi:hypothetical protein
MGGTRGQRRCGTCFARLGPGRARLGQSSTHFSRTFANARSPIAHQLEGTLVASCEKHGINAIEYLTDMLMRVQTHAASKIDELLPHRRKPPDAPPEQ